jgi:FAD synthase
VLYPDTAGKNLKMISSFAEKCVLLEEAGLDHLVVMEFTREFARTSSEAFVKHFLVDKLHAHTIVVGFNHFFGHNKQGSYASLYRDRKKYGYRVEEIPEQEIQNETVSSTRIRKALSEGNIQRANAYLEHFFLVLTTLQPVPGSHGEGGFSRFVFPVDDAYKLLPPQGAYAISFQLQNTILKGLALIGPSENSLLPLEPLTNPGEQIVRIQFHKQIQSGPSALNLLNTVRELIY